MSYLFKIQSDKNIYPNSETLLISPFKEIWNRDKTKSKVNATEDFAYIEFMTSKKKTNPFRQYKDEDRRREVKRVIITRKNWKEDKLIKQGMEFIHKLQKEASTTYSYYIAAKKAAEEMENFFLNLDLTAVNAKTLNPLYKPADITRALNDTEKVLTNLKSLEKQVEEELFESVKSRGDKIISYFANPENA